MRFHPISPCPSRTPVAYAPGSPRPGRPGIVILAVLVVVVILLLAAYQYSAMVLAERQAADSFTRTVQARTLADSGVHYTAAILSNPEMVTNVLNGNLYDNPQAFQGILVQQGDRPGLQGRFSVVAPHQPGETANLRSLRYGVTDESGKININALMQLDSSGKIAHDVLINLPNMTEDIANAILDWIDPDSDTRPGGAESDAYGPTYSCKNGPLESIEELLLVKGVTPQLLLGNDRNRNGILDPEENDGTGELDRGWAAYLTVYSREQNVDADGNARIYINDSDLDSLNSKLQTALGPDLANYIQAYRMYGPAQSGSRGGGTQPSRPQQSAPLSPGDRESAMQALGNARRNSRQMRLRSISSLYELVDSEVSIPNSNPRRPPIRFPSPLNDRGTLRDRLPVLLDKVATVRDAEIPARININTAPQAVLAALPGLADADVQNILDHRPDPSSQTAPDSIYQTPAWLITEANFSPQTLRTLERYITARSQVYRVQVVGHFDGGGPSARIEAVIDTNAGRPRIAYWRDLTELGKGFDLQK